MVVFVCLFNFNTSLHPFTSFTSVSGWLHPICHSFPHSVTHPLLVKLTGFSQRSFLSECLWFRCFTWFPHPHIHLLPRPVGYTHLLLTCNTHTHFKADRLLPSVNNAWMHLVTLLFIQFPQAHLHSLPPFPHPVGYTSVPPFPTHTPIPKLTGSSHRSILCPWGAGSAAANLSLARTTCRPWPLCVHGSCSCRRPPCCTWW